MRSTTISSLRQRMIEDMTARKFGPHSQRSHIESCERFAAYLKHSPVSTAEQYPASVAEQKSATLVGDL